MNDYYRKISLIEARSYLTSDNREQFTHNQFNIIKKLSPDIEISSDKIRLINISGDFNFSITKLKDEWFLIYSTYVLPESFYYICDQFDGLLKCIEDLYVK